MRRPVILLTTLAAVLSLAGSAAASPGHGIGDGHHEARAGDTLAFGAEALADEAHVAPLGSRLSAGAATVSGTLYDSYHSPSGSARVEWWAEESDGWYTGHVTTAANGSFSMTTMPTSNGEIWAYPNDASVFSRGGDTWVDGGSYGRTLYPGRVNAGATLGGPWYEDFEYLTVRLWGDSRFSRGEVPTDGSSTPAELIDVLDGTYTAGSAKFFYDEGVEFAGPIGVTSGSQSGATIWADEAGAQRVEMTSPFWDSGKPGATVKILRGNFPAGWVNNVTGYTDDPDDSGSAEYGDKTSSGAAEQSFSVKIPAKAKPGYSYWIGLDHVNGIGTLSLETPYQVCTMKASKTAVKKGARIRVTGVIPTQGHWGKETGLKKPVTLFAHKGTVKAPTVWEPKSQGWVKVGSVKTNGFGAYKTPYFKPRKSMTLVVRYPGDDWYFDAYTSTQKITVR